MKNLFIFFASFSGLCAFSQDIIYVKDGSVINAKVTEINEETIKYKSEANPEGPMYVLNKGKISSIHYKNGCDEVFTAPGSTDQNNGALCKVENGYNTSTDNSAAEANTPPVTYPQQQPVYQKVNRNGEILLDIVLMGLYTAATISSHSGHHSGNYRTSNCSNSNYGRRH